MPRANAKLREPTSETGTLVTRALVPVENSFGLALPDNLAFSEWIDRGRALLADIDSAQLRLGDLIVYGERHFGEQVAEIYTEYNKDTLRKAAQVCRGISYERRQQNYAVWKHLSFSHLDAVAALPEGDQDEMLALAVRHRWSRSQLRDEVSSRHPDRRGTRVARTASALRLVDPEESRAPTLLKAADIGKRPEPSAEEREARTAEPVTIIVPAGRPVETEGAAQYLATLARSAQGKQLRESLSAVLDERDRFIAIVNAAKRAVMAGEITAELTAVVSETVDPTYGRMIDLLTEAGAGGLSDSDLEAAGVARAATAGGLRSGAIVHKPVGLNSSWRWFLEQKH